MEKNTNTNTNRDIVTKLMSATKTNQYEVALSVAKEVLRKYKSEGGTDRYVEECVSAIEEYVKNPTKHNAYSVRSARAYLYCRTWDKNEIISKCISVIIYMGTVVVSTRRSTRKDKLWDGIFYAFNIGEIKNKILKNIKKNIGEKI